MGANVSQPTKPASESLLQLLAHVTCAPGAPLPTYKTIVTEASDDH